MSATRKIEITEHTQQNWMERTLDQLAPYRRAILGLVLALIVGIIAIALLTRQSEQKTARAWDNYFTITEITPANEEAARKMITELGATEPGLMLKMKFAQYLLREGTQLLFSDKAAGTKKINEAKEGFNSVASASKNSLAIEESLLGAAVCESALGNQEAAVAAYEKQLQQFPQGMFAKVATTNMDRIKTGAAKEWYAWFNSADVSNRSLDSFPDFGKQPGTGSLPSLEGPGSLMPAFDTLNPFGSSGVPSTTPGLPSFTIPDSPAGKDAPVPESPPKDGTTTPEKSTTVPAATDPAATEPAADGILGPALTPEKPITPEASKAEPAKSEPAKDEPAKEVAEPPATIK